MITKTRLFGVLCTAGGLTVGAVLLGACSPSSGGTTSLHYSIKETSFVPSELGTAGVAPGTEVAETGEILSASTQVGRYIVNCTADTGGNSAEVECIGTSWIGSGSNELTWVGPTNLAAADNVLTVTGGSGRYFGMRGQLLLHFSNEEGSAGTVTFKLES